MMDIVIIGSCRQGKREAIEALQEVLKNRAEIVGYGVDFGNMNGELIRKAAMLDVGFIHMTQDSLVLMESEPKYSPGISFSYSGSIDEYFKELQLALEKLGSVSRDTAMRINQPKGLFEEMKQTIVYEKPQSKFISRPRNNFKIR